MVGSIYSGTRIWNIHTTAIQNGAWPYILPLELLKRSGSIRMVMRTHYANDTMLRRSDQLLLAAENLHFEGSTHLRSKEGTEARLGEEGREGAGSFFDLPSA